MVRTCYEQSKPGCEINFCQVLYVRELILEGILSCSMLCAFFQVFTLHLTCNGNISVYPPATLSLLHCNSEWTRLVPKFWEVIKLCLCCSYSSKDNLDLLALTHLTCLGTDNSVTVALQSVMFLPKPCLGSCLSGSEISFSWAHCCLVSLVFSGISLWRKGMWVGPCRSRNFHL